MRNAKQSIKHVPARMAAALDRLPEPVRLEVQDATSRLKKVRSVEEASALVSYEIERLLTVVVPMFAKRPLRVGPKSGRVVVGLTAAGAALLEEFEAIASVVSFGAAAPGAPVVLAADFAALVMEAYVATSVRMHMLKRAGLPVIPEEIAKDLAKAMSGNSGSATRDITREVANGIAKRVLKRWAAGVTPIAGIAYDGWDAQKTVAAIAGMPLPGDPPPPRGLLRKFELKDGGILRGIDLHRKS